MAQGWQTPPPRKENLEGIQNLRSHSQEPTLPAAEAKELRSVTMVTGTMAPIRLLRKHCASVFALWSTTNSEMQRGLGLPEAGRSALGFATN